MTRSPRMALVTLAAAVMSLGACTESAHHSTTAPAAATTSASSSAAQSSPPPAKSPAAKAPAVNPLTGGRPSTNPVVVVKIEDTALGRPQANINKADIVYIEQVEGGLTRLVAVFNSQLPTVEPVRSTRANDPELVSEYGNVIYVASGGSGPELAPLDHSGLRADINDRGGPGFQRDPSRVIPNNLQANLAVISKHFPTAPRAKSIGLTWSTKITNTKTSPGTVVQTRVGGTPVTFTWWPKLHRYVRSIDGVVQRTASHQLIATPNVIVQFCRSTVYWRDIDDAGNPAQFTHTIGSGPVVVFRDGRRIVGTWHRNSYRDGTVLTAGGQQISLSPGGAWFVLAAQGTPLP